MMSHFPPHYHRPKIWDTLLQRRFFAANGDFDTCLTAHISDSCWAES
jgi:hypothetical protein